MDGFWDEVRFPSVVLLVMARVRGMWNGPDVRRTMMNDASIDLLFKVINLALDLQRK